MSKALDYWTLRVNTELSRSAKIWDLVSQVKMQGSYCGRLGSRAEGTATRASIPKNPCRQAHPQNIGADLGIAGFICSSGRRRVVALPSRQNRSAVSRTGNNPAKLDRCLAATRFDKAPDVAMAEAASWARLLHIR